MRANPEEFRPFGHFHNFGMQSGPGPLAPFGPRAATCAAVPKAPVGRTRLNGPARSASAQRYMTATQEIRAYHPSTRIRALCCERRPAGCRLGQQINYHMIKQLAVLMNFPLQPDRPNNKSLSLSFSRKNRF